VDRTKSTAAVTPIVVTVAALAFAGGARGTGRRLWEEQQKTQARATSPAVKQKRAKNTTSKVSPLQEQESLGHHCNEQKLYWLHGCRSPDALPMGAPTKRTPEVSGGERPTPTESNERQLLEGGGATAAADTTGTGDGMTGDGLKRGTLPLCYTETDRHTERVVRNGGRLYHPLTVTDAGGDGAPRGKRGVNNAQQQGQGAPCATRRAAKAATVCAKTPPRGRRHHAGK